MKKALLVLAILAVGIGLSFAQDYESIVVNDTAKTLTKSYFNPHDSYNDKALVTIAGANIRVRMDGTAPTTTEGHILEDGDSLTIDSREMLNNFKAIRDDSTNATISITYYQGE